MSYRLAENVVQRSTTNGLSMLFDRQKGVMYELNETASEVVSLLASGPQTIKVMVAELGKAFDAAPEEITSDVDKMLMEFTEAGLVHADSGVPS